MLRLRRLRALVDGVGVCVRARVCVRKAARAMPAAQILSFSLTLSVYFAGYVYSGLDFCSFRRLQKFGKGWRISRLAEGQMVVRPGRSSTAYYGTK